MNRAQLRPHRDTQIRARDIVAFGDSSIAFRLVALKPDNIPTALETAADVLSAQCSSAALGWDARSMGEADGCLEEEHSELLSQAQSSGSDGTVWLQVPYQDALQPTSQCCCIAGSDEHAMRHEALEVMFSACQVD